MDIRIEKYKIYTSFLSPERLKAESNKTGFDFMILFNIRENCLQYDMLHEFSVWLRTSCNPADINRFWSHTEKNISILHFT